MRRIRNPLGVGGSYLERILEAGGALGRHGTVMEPGEVRDGSTAREWSARPDTVGTFFRSGCESVCGAAGRRFSTQSATRVYFDT